MKTWWQKQGTKTIKEDYFFDENEDSSGEMQDLFIVLILGSFFTIALLAIWWGFR